MPDRQSGSSAAGARDGTLVDESECVRAITCPYTGGDGTSLPMHVFAPARSGSVAAVLLFHGGGWSSGEPAQLFPQCRALARAGVLAESTGYRLIGRDAPDLAACVSDAWAAWDTFCALAAFNGVDARRFSAGGASAGGHLAASIAMFPIHARAVSRSTQ